MTAEKQPSVTRAVLWIVDDLRSEVASLTRLLSADFTLEIFETGPQMLERLKSAPPPDVLVIEQWLRGPTGVEICRALRESPATVGLPILLLTVPVDDDEILQGLAAGADDYLIKPFSPPLLAARIVALIRMKRLRERAERAEAEARNERDRFEALIEQSGDGILAADENGALRVCNQEARRQRGLAPDEVLSGGAVPRFELLTLSGHPIPVDEMPLYRAIRGERIEESRWLVRRPDGSVRVLAGNASPLRHPDGSPAGAVLTTRDETERMRLEEALRRSQTWLARTLESVGDALIATDEAGRVVFMNPVAVQLTGWTIDDARGRPLEEVLDIVNETTRLPVENPVAKVLRDGKVVGLANHTVLRSKDGTEVAIDDSAAPIRDEQGRIFGVVLVFRDVAEARRKDAELQAAHREADLERERLATVILQAPVAVAILRGDDNVVVLANDAICRLWNCTREAAIGRPVFEIHVAAKEQGFPALLAQVRRTGEPFVGREVPVVMPGGEGDAETVILNFVYQPLQDAEGSIADILVVAIDLTEQVQARHRVEAFASALRASESKLHDLFMQAPVAIAILEGPEHVFTLANPAYRALVGGRDVAGKPLLEALPDVKGQGFDQLLDRVMATGEPFFARAMEIKLANLPEGETLSLDFVYSPKRDAEGRVDGVLVSAVDVTEQVHARRAAEALTAELRTSEERLRRVVEASSAGLWDLDAATGEIEADARMVALMGFPPGSTFNLETGLDNLPPDDAERIGAAVAAALAGANEGRYLMEFRTGVKSGAPLRWVESRAQVLFDAEGKAKRLAGAMIDITARKQVEAVQQSLLEVLQRSEQGLRTLAEAIPQQVWTSRPDGALDFVNERVLAYFATTEEHILGAGWQGVIHPDDLPACVERWTHSLSTGDEYEVEFRLKRADDTYRWHLGRAVVVRDSHGAIVKWFGTNTDIHEAKQNREELEARTRFEQHLLGIVSHDLRNPLGAILLGAIGLLETEESEWVTSIAERIRSSAERSTRMISDLLDFTQARLGGGIRVTPSPVDLHTLAAAAIHEVESSFPDRAVELRREGETQGTWDADRLAQVVTNLVTNALKYSPAGTPVEVHTIARDGSVELTVHNVGAPIPAERLGQIFEPLQRATDEIDMKTRSVGLGLYIVDAIVKAHSGTVGVVSTAESGTTFTVRLPRRAAG